MYRVLVDGGLICDSRSDELALIDPVLDLEVNTAGEFSFTFPPGHPFYGSIERRASMVEVYRDGEMLFEGICTEVEVDFYGQKTVTCEGSLTFFNDSVQRPAYYQGLTCRQLLETYVSAHNALVEEPKRFIVGQVTVADDYISCYSNYETTMECLKDDLVDDLGGYFRVRKENGVRYLDYLAESPRTNSQVILLGENLLDFTTNLDTEELATVIIPLGETLDESPIEGLDARLDIKSVNDGKDYVYSPEAVKNFGWIEKVVEWPDVTVAANLKAKGEKYLADTQYENMTIEARAIDLHLADSAVQSFRLLDKIRVESRPHGLDRYFLLSAMTINLNNPESDSITLGVEENASLTAKSQSTSSSILKRIEQVPTSAAVQSAIKNATAQITGAEGGYVVIEANEEGKPKEIRVQDALMNPTKIWRWNVNGLGYSKDGGKTYGLAMTMDGAIVADYITSGSLYADRIKGGTLTLGGVNNTDGQMVVKAADGSTTGTWTNEGIQLYSGKIGPLDISEEGLRFYSGGTWAASDYYATFGGDTAFPEGPFTFSTYKKINESATALVAYISMAGHGEFDTLTSRGTLTLHEDVTVSPYSGAAHVNGSVYFNDPTYFMSNLVVFGDKTRAVETKNHGTRTLHAYETPTPYFGDIGEGALDETGQCDVYIDDILSECIDLTGDYQVFLQKYGEGDAYVATREADHFIVKGTPGLCFGWELKAVQRDYNGMRFRTVNPAEKEDK